MLVAPFWIVERAREIAESTSSQQCCEVRARRKTREETEEEAGGKGTVLLAVTDTFECPVTPVTENSDWSVNNSCCQTNLKSNQLFHNFFFVSGRSAAVGKRCDGRFSHWFWEIYHLSKPTMAKSFIFHILVTK